jgi:putative hydrolase of the HAD superfamily
MPNSRYKIIFTDVGGVIATNGWDTPLRQKVVNHFHLDADEVDSRHHLVFDAYESGKIPFDEYLRWTIMYESRPFSLEEVRTYVFDQGQMLPGMYDLYQRVKSKNGIKLALISNEGGGLTENRVEKFKLRELADYQVFSCLVEMRKPDPQIWKLALGLGQVTAAESIYIDDRKLFADFAGELGFMSHQHVSVEDTKSWLAGVGLEAG